MTELAPALSGWCTKIILIEDTGIGQTMDALSVASTIPAWVKSMTKVVGVNPRSY